MTNSTSLGRLQKIAVRDIWKTEAQDFTPWLAQPDNLAVLSEALDMELEIEAQEKNVGPFRADILCKDTGDSSWVLIENQLERTDHTHLGQLLTYASGLDAVTIVWVSTQFTEEHRAALDWLNKITDEKFRFFGLEVELWRIGDSPAAPKFNIISKPNEWSRLVGQAAHRIENDHLTDTRALQLKFWTQLKQAVQKHSTLRAQRAAPSSVMAFSIGRSRFYMLAKINSLTNSLHIELHIVGEHAKAHFNLLKADSISIEAEFGSKLEWQEQPDRERSRIILSLEDVDPFDQERWLEYQRWMIDSLERFNAVFRERIRNLNADNYDPQAEDD